MLLGEAPVGWGMGPILPLSLHHVDNEIVFYRNKRQTIIGRNSCMGDCSFRSSFDVIISLLVVILSFKTSEFRGQASGNNGSCGVK